MTRLKGKVALVTGGAAGLGKAIARKLAADGARVVISDVDSRLGRETQAQIGAIFLEQDVCDEARWLEVIRDVEHRLGPLQVLVNNAGILGSMAAVSPEDTPLSQWRRIFAVNVEGTFLGCRAAIPAMRQAGGGSIINIASIAGLSATPHATAYGASKATVRQLTKTVAQYCAQHRFGIRCNSVHPGDVRTPLWDRHAEEVARMRGLPVEDVVADALADCPMGGETLPEDVADAVSFLASDEARRITGTKILVDGGRIACNTYQKIRT